jgi:hypothetical protein
MLDILNLSALLKPKLNNTNTGPLGLHTTTHHHHHNITTSRQRGSGLKGVPEKMCLLETYFWQLLNFWRAIS